MSRRALVRPASEWVNTTTQTVRRYSGNPSLEAAYFDPLVRAPGSERYSDLQDATNLFTRSEELDHSDWSKANVDDIITADQAVGPDGATAMEEMTESGNAGGHGVIRSVALTANASYAMSVWYKANTRTIAYMELQDVGSPGNRINAWYDLSAGTVGTTGENGTASFSQAYMEDWTAVEADLYRCVIVGSIGNDATSIRARVQMADADGNRSYTGDGSSSIYAGYAQIEDDAGRAGLYVQTTTAAVT